MKRDFKNISMRDSLKLEKKLNIDLKSFMKIKSKNYNIQIKL